jgi:hypothetical protein
LGHALECLGGEVAAIELGDPGHDGVEQLPRRRFVDVLQTDDAGVAVVLVDLFHIDYDDFDPDSPDNQLDYNADDLLPEDCETPEPHG